MHPLTNTWNSGAATFLSKQLGINMPAHMIQNGVPLAILSQLKLGTLIANPAPLRLALLLTELALILRLKRTVKPLNGTGTSQAMTATRRHRVNSNAPPPIGIGTSPATAVSRHPRMACAGVALIGVTILPQAALHRDWEYSAASATAARPLSAGVFRTTGITTTTTAPAADATGAAARR